MPWQVSSSLFSFFNGTTTFLFHLKYTDFNLPGKDQPQTFSLTSKLAVGTCKCDKWHTQLMVQIISMMIKYFLTEFKPKLV